MLSPAERWAKIKAIIRAATGNFLEVYDYLAYGFVATYIAAAYFPTQSEFTSLMLSLAAFGIAAVARPVGAIVLGSYMDRNGRRKGLLLTLGLMAVGTLSIAMTPSYAAIGLLAPSIVVAGRLIQGFSFGAEASGVTVYLAEIATPGHRGFYCAWQAGTQALAVIFAASVGVALTTTFTVEQMASWGWRVPLLIGCLVIPILFWLRRSLEETEVFLRSRPARTTNEVLRDLSEHGPILVASIAMTTFTTVSFYLVTLYTPIYGTQALHLTAVESLVVTLCAGVTLFAFILMGGALSDRIGRWPLVIVAPLLALASAYPVMSWLIAAPSFGGLLLVELWLSLLSALHIAGLTPLLPEIMPSKARTSGMAIVLSLANGVFGGFTPAIGTYLIESTGDSASPALWLSLIACISIGGAIAAWRVTPRLALREALT